MQARDVSARGARIRFVESSTAAEREAPPLLLVHDGVATHETFLATMEHLSSAFRVIAPDLPGCEVTAASRETALPTLRLAIEGRITEFLLAGQPLPETREGTLPPGRPDLAGAEALTIHINVAHLVALANHQRGR